LCILQGVEEVDFEDVQNRLRSLLTTGGANALIAPKPTLLEWRQVLDSLGAIRLLIVEVLTTQRSPRVRLNCQLDDVSFALQDDKLFGALLAS
jgi:hypothetical protein